MIPDIYKIDMIGKGTLSVMAKPLSGEFIEEEFRGIANVGITTIVSLLETYEAIALGLAQERLLAEKNGMEFLSFPIPDRGLPPSVVSFANLTRHLYLGIVEGQNIVIHCRAGIGRTGLVTAGVLLHRGLTAEKAFELISIKRRVSVPDTQEQIDWLVNNTSTIQKCA